MPHNPAFRWAGPIEEIVDPMTDLVDPTTEEVVATTETPPETAEPSPEPQTEDDVPEKFRGKALKDVVTSYQHLESEVGRYRNELGAQRRVIDELLGINRAKVEKSRQEAKPVTPHDLAERPEETIVNVASRVADERLERERSRINALEADVMEQRLAAKHGNFRDTLSSSEFQSWAQGSQYRIGLIQRAANGDMQAGDEVLSLYKEYGSAKAPAKEQPKQNSGVEAARKVETAKSGGSGANKIVNSQPGKKTWTRTELANLYVNDPDTYNRMSDSGELDAIYAEKRIR